jgi:microcystin-dependent protein
MSSTQLAIFQKQIMRTLNMFDDKIVNIYKLGSQQFTKFGFNTVSPQYTLDVDNNVNVTDDYYIRGQLFLPVGTILPYAGLVDISNNTLSGWLICDGRELNIEDYDRLFNIIGTTYGGGEGTFNIPDMRGRVPVGSGTGAGLSTRNVSSLGGAETHTLTTNEMPSHTHTGTTSTNGEHTHTYLGLQEQSASGISTTSVAENDPRPTETTSAAGNHNHTFTTNSTGGGNAHNNMQPYIVINYIIRC